MITVPMLRGRPRRRPDRGARRRRPRHQGHVVRAGVLQPDRRHLLLGEGPAARADAHGGNGFPAVLGQRLRGAHADPRLRPADRRAGSGRRRGQPEPAVGVRLDLQDHLRGCRGELLRRLAGQHRLVPAARGQEVDRARQGQPPAPPAVLRATPTACGCRCSAISSCWPRSSRWSQEILEDRLGESKIASWTDPEGRLLRQPRRAGPAPPSAPWRLRRTRASPSPRRVRRSRIEKTPRTRTFGSHRPSRRCRTCGEAIDGLATCALLAATEALLKG